jgi:acetyl-CoA C-acetyltransferase
LSAYVWGVGTSNFGKQPELTSAELTWIAVKEAMRDAGVSKVDAVFVGTCFGEPGIAQRSLHGLGIVGLPIAVYENACASSTHAFHEARIAVEAGRFDTVLVVGIEHLTSRFSGAIPVEQRDLEGRTGLGLPALYAMGASRYQSLYGLTNEQLATVSVKNHANGVLNPRAQHGKQLTVEEVLASPMISDPLTLLQCCAITDASAACIIGRTQRSDRDITIRGSVMKSGTLWDQTSEHPWGFDLIRDTALEAYEATGIGVDEVDFFEVHDAFTIGEIITTEALGLAPIGLGGELVMSGRTELRGAQPVNPSGGLQSRGHPLGATGAAQIAELVWQLRGDAGGRQLDAPRIGVAETMGGGAGGVDGNACVIAILGN